MSEVQQEVTDHLLKELTAILQEASTTKINVGEIGVLDALNSPDIDMSSSVNRILSDFGERLNKLVVQDARFPGNNPKMIGEYGGTFEFYPNYVGIYLVRRTLQTNSPEAAIESLRKVLTSTFATGKTIYPIWGVTVAQEIQLTETVKVVPIEQIPDSAQKEWITGHKYYSSNSPIMSAFDFEAPTAALLANRRIEPIISDASTKLIHDDVSKTDELLKDITLALTVVGPRASIPSTNWFTFDDPDIQQSSLMSGLRRFAPIEILPRFSMGYPLLDAFEAKSIVQAYLTLPKETRNRVRVALKRLNQAQLRHDVGDRALELSTAFETLLGDNGKTEMTHKIKVRSVRLIGGTDEVRKKNSAIINKTYGIRSCLVHTGVVDNAGSETICGQQTRFSEIIDHATIMCADLIKIIIRSGSIPDWPDFDIAEKT
jgi:hypothetical protein